MLIGNYGDRAGRKAALTLTILLMAAGTGIIAFSPTYAAIGIGAPLLLLLGRVLQGFSAGGEVGGATAYLLESADPAAARPRRLLARGQHGHGEYPGCAGGILGQRGLEHRPRCRPGAGASRSSSDCSSPRWACTCAAPWMKPRRFRQRRGSAPRIRRKARLPLLEIFRHHGRSLFVGFCVAVLWAVAVYVLMIFLPTYVQHPDTFNFSARQAFGASLIGNIPFVIGCVWFGSLSDRIGRRRSLFISAALLLFWCCRCSCG